MSYNEALEKLAGTTARGIEWYYARYLDGTYDLDKLKTLISLSIASANAQGRMLAQVSFLAWLRENVPEPVEAAGIDTATKTVASRSALTKAAETILAGDSEDAPMRLERLARSAPVEASQEAFIDVIDTSQHTSGYTRQLEPGACALCRKWSQGGAVQHGFMPTHTSCQCWPLPALAQKQ